MGIARWHSERVAPDKSVHLLRRKMLKLYSYIVARDYGFAPNPFCGVCTLATCKPIIRRVAQLGDWIVGTGSGSRNGRLVYAMKVTESLCFNEYWERLEFQCKKPKLQASKKLAFGDNIYHMENGRWTQLNSHHSLCNGRPNQGNIRNDTQTNRVLASNKFVYYGGTGPIIPRRFRNYQGVDVCARRGHRVNYPPGLVADFVAWVAARGDEGFVGEPLDWCKSP